MLKQEILKKEFFKYLNQGFENLKYIRIKEDRNNLTKHVNTLYTVRDFMIEGLNNVEIKRHSRNLMILMK